MSDSNTIEYITVFNSTTERNLFVVSIAFLYPLCLLIDFGVFIYLGNIYLRKRRDWVINTLIVVSFLAFAILIPYAYNFDNGVIRLQCFNISDALSVVTFLIRVYIICRDVTKAMMANRILTIFFIIAKILIFLELFDTFAAFLALVSNGRIEFYPQILSNIAETASLIFVMVFRFYYLSLLKGGWGAIFRDRLVEVFFYCLFVIHEVVITAIEDATGYSLEAFAGFWMRSCIAILVYLSAVRSRGKTFAISKGATSVQPSSMAESNVHKTQIGSIVPDADAH